MGKPPAQQMRSRPDTADLREPAKDPAPPGLFDSLQGDEFSPDSKPVSSGFREPPEDTAASGLFDTFHVEPPEIDVDGEDHALGAGDNFQPMSAGAIQASEFTGTIIYVHGIANKPIASVLKSQWDMALFGCELGERSRMVYWVNRNRYPTPYESASYRPDTCDNIDYTATSEQFPLTESFSTRSLDAERTLAERLGRNNPEAGAFLRNLIEQIEKPALTSESGDLARQAELFPGGPWIRDWITRRVTRAFLPDVYDYFFDDRFAANVDRLFCDRVEKADGPLIVVGHSLGSVIAYKNLVRLSQTGASDDVQLFLTLGSPLGILEVQEQLMKSLRVRRLSVPGNIRQWINAADRLDPVAIDPRLDNDFDGSIVDKPDIRNVDSPRHPHSATGYLQVDEVRSSILNITGGSFGQELTDFVIAKDVSREIENVLSPFSDPNDMPRQEVLIEVRESAVSVDVYPGGLQRPANARGKLELGKREIERKLIEEIGVFPEDIEPLERFVAARLTPPQIERLAKLLNQHDVKFARIWSDAEKYTLSRDAGATDTGSKAAFSESVVRDSQDVVHTAAALRVYGTDGTGITWAVLDTGINHHHPHFQLPRNGNVVAKQFDCTSRGVQELDLDVRVNLDPHGHGTHVGAIISGGRYNGERNDNRLITANAPCCKLISYKVLDVAGKGRDSFVIKALQHIANHNEQAGYPAIQGINLSLGGPFDAEVYGCGHSPVCKELRRLWRQGVLVVVSAGNAGFAELQSRSGPLRANMDLSIGDPANLEEAIAVGSVHRSKPWTYGVSYFSSKGPTSDGRQKPDLVAPGEKIKSANSRCTADPATWYVRKSGTSMAAPEVSGVLAGFLSQRRELIGRPDDVKKILLENCTDIGRAREHQGAGIPNLVKMLLAT
ncbi:MAG: S8 family peptidase [Planctomycetota bacterium]